jgi:hypothetical protein
MLARQVLYYRIWPLFAGHIQQAVMHYSMHNMQNVTLLYITVAVMQRITVIYNIQVNISKRNEAANGLPLIFHFH